MFITLGLITMVARLASADPAAMSPLQPPVAAMSGEAAAPRVLGPYDPFRVVKKPRRPGAKPLVAITKPKPGCRQMRNALEMMIPLNKPIKRLLVRCFETDDWALDLTANDRLPNGLTIERVSKSTPEGEYIRYFLVGKTVQDSRYAEVEFTTPSRAITYRIQTAQPQDFSDECATADLNPFIESQTDAPIDYQIGLCNVDVDGELDVQVEPALPEGVTIQTRRVRPNRVLLIASGTAAQAVQGVYHLKVSRSGVLLNPITLQVSVSEPPSKDNKVMAALEELNSEAAKVPPSIVLNLTGEGEVYVDQQKVTLPFQLELDSSEHVVKVTNGGRVEYARRIPKLADYQGPALDIWNIVIHGSASGIGYQSDREVLAAKIADLQKRRTVEKDLGRRPASVTASLGLDSRMSIREMDMSVELKLLRSEIRAIRH